MRFRIDLSYVGTNFCGWQRQPGSPSVQETIEDVFQTILRQPVEIVGCGRTDTGVHARHYMAHMDVADMGDISKFLYQVNAMLPHDIAIHSLEKAAPDFHARYSAIDRLYRYYMHFQKDPFLQHTSWHFKQQEAIDIELLHAAANALLDFTQFKPLSKTGSDVDHFACQLFESHWKTDERHAVYTIRANRFLRGMVRLTVGACLQVALGKITLAELQKSLQEQTPLPHAWSVPAEGLFLEEIRYPD